MGKINHERAGWAFAACKAFANKTGQTIGIKTRKEDLSEIIGDLICDLLHWAEQNNIDAQSLHEKALDTWAGEVYDDE